DANTVSRNAGVGLWLDACGTLSVTHNVVTENGADGIRMYVGNTEDAQVKLGHNRVMQNADVGINLNGGPSDDPKRISVTGNTVLGQQVDLADDSPNCGGATWRHNTFKTASQPCIR